MICLANIFETHVVSTAKAGIENKSLLLCLRADHRIVPIPHVLLTAGCVVLPLNAPLTPLTVGRGTLIW